MCPSFPQNDLGEYLYGEPSYEFHVDNEITSDLQLNVDLTVAMPCRCALLTSTAPLSAPTFLTLLLLRCRPVYRFAGCRR
jgi:hypothetical protein